MVSFCSRHLSLELTTLDPSDLLSYFLLSATSQFSEARENRQIIRDPFADRPGLAHVKIYIALKAKRK